MFESRLDPRGVETQEKKGTGLRLGSSSGGRLGRWVVGGWEGRTGVGITLDPPNVVDHGRFRQGPRDEHLGSVRNRVHPSYLPLTLQGHGNRGRGVRHQETPKDEGSLTCERTGCRTTELITDLNGPEATTLVSNGRLHKNNSTVIFL